MQLAISFILAFEKPESEGPSKNRIRKGTDTPKGSVDDRIYLNAIGVPRGALDDYKARYQTATGLESLLWLSTINKNVN